MISYLLVVSVVLITEKAILMANQGTWPLRSSSSWFVSTFYKMLIIYASKFQHNFDDVQKSSETWSRFQRRWKLSRCQCLRAARIKPCILDLLLMLILQLIRILNVPGTLNCGTKWSLTMSTASLKSSSSSPIGVPDWKTLTHIVWTTQECLSSTPSKQSRVCVEGSALAVIWRLTDRLTKYPVIWSAEMKWSWNCYMTAASTKLAFTWER